MYRQLLLCVQLLLVTACVGADSSGPPLGACDEASLQLEECVRAAQEDDKLPVHCEKVAAKAMKDCPPEKADTWGISLCEFGLLHYCSTPSCEVPLGASHSDCAAFLEEEGCAACDYYLCKEADDGAFACGDRGYYLGYGYKYCERISLVTRPRLSSAGQAWVDETRACLIRAVEQGVDDQDSCSRIKQFAFDSHPGCYLNAGFCDLPVSDMWAVFTTIDPSDFELQQVLSTGVSCLRDLF